MLPFGRRSVSPSAEMSRGMLLAFVVISQPLAEWNYGAHH